MREKYENKNWEPVFPMISKPLSILYFHSNGRLTRMIIAKLIFKKLGRMEETMWRVNDIMDEVQIAYAKRHREEKASSHPRKSRADVFRFYHKKWKSVEGQEGKQS